MKKLFAILLTLALGMSAAALTLDNAEAANEAPTAVLAEETATSNAGKPGYNLWTGTTEAYTFDGDLELSNSSTTGDINVDWNQANVYVDTTVESGNPVMRMATTRAHFSVNSPFSIEGTRPVTLSFKFKYNYTDPIYMSFRANNYGFWTDGTYNWESSGYQVLLSNGNETGWTSQSKTFNAGDAVKKSVETVPETVTKFWFNFASQNYTSPCYIDDVSITPHYKITYDIGGGEGETPADEYFLADSYTLKADTSTFSAPGGVAEFSHWEDQFGREIVTTVTPVLGEDLVLTAVYEDTSNYAPQTEPGAEMRLSSNTATNGIRFKASIATSKKALADEIGFIGAREDVLDYLGADLTFDLTAEDVENAEGTLYVKGVAYDKATGKDIVYGTTEDGSAEIFTCVCVGINIESNAQVTSILVVRPYTKLTINGNAITVYGTENSASLANIATALKTAAESGDEAALDAYNGAKTYVDTVIETAALN